MNHAKTTTINAAFYAMGLLNNASYVIMLAGAKNISDGGTALVFIANILPCLLVKSTGPYWFHLVSYSKRINICAMLFALSFSIVSYFSRANFFCKHAGGSASWQLLGVAFGSFGSGMGESSLLALAGRLPNTCNTCITTTHDDDEEASSSVTSVKAISSFSSGTGAAGVFGYFFMVLIHDWLGLEFGQTLMIGNLVAVFYAAVFHRYLICFDNGEENDNMQSAECRPAVAEELPSSVAASSPPLQFSEQGTCSRSSSRCSPLQQRGSYTMVEEHDLEQHNRDVEEDNDCEDNGIIRSNNNTMEQMTLREQILFALSLWKFMMPLFLVYAAEYAMQSGTWAAIGFPTPDNESARADFYEYSNWIYQVGVLISRSTGTLYEASFQLLWVFSFLQILLLVFFYMVASTQFWYDWSLLLPSFIVGLLGGSVYVQSFTRISRDVVRVDLREFALAATSVADTMGIVVADICGLYIQSCLFRVNGIPGAVVECPLA
mmetsp:Transcript_25955/g.40287  ORF Transcript_25955/g.40287 Transcript_25955/m.40287 type:complete len:491 (-) Transcript_25955:505-1977(-)|eukprot:CAMPEP_0196801136 /NCGR_PEP_ID=MMETSP1362-20130617/818_1 /TAXON_ID=163516 /ORGANISM="Leptocylindrus danicus, Strain CCMP1856" /LENGTH=490 /DNA_ID=CAMNT_0042171903 /DNA_START=32 /DNA_END=1504 /DNA_ORIENTATION=+